MKKIFFSKKKKKRTSKNFLARILFRFCQQSCEKGRKTVQRQKLPKEPVFHRPTVHKKRPQSSKISFPFEKKHSENFFFSYFVLSRHLKSLSNKMSVKKEKILGFFFDDILTFHLKLMSFYLTNWKLTKIRSFSTNLINPPQLMNKPSATSLKKVQVTEDNSTRKTKISSFKLKVTIVMKMKKENQELFLNQSKDMKILY